jgi:hypothetical protein
MTRRSFKRSIGPNLFTYYIIYLNKFFFFTHQPELNSQNENTQHTSNSTIQTEVNLTFLLSHDNNNHITDRGTTNC